MDAAEIFIVKDVPGIAVGVFDISSFDLVGIILIDLNEDFIAETDGDIVITFVVDTILSILIGVVKTALIDVIRYFSLDSESMSDETIFADAAWWIFVDVLKGFVGNENGALVVYPVVGVTFGVYWTYADRLIPADPFVVNVVNIVVAEPSIANADEDIAMNINWSIRYCYNFWFLCTCNWSIGY